MYQCKEVAPTFSISKLHTQDIYIYIYIYIQKLTVEQYSYLWEVNPISYVNLLWRKCSNKRIFPPRMHWFIHIRYHFFHNCSHTELWPPLTQLVLWPSPIHLPSHQKWEPEWVIIDTISLPTTCWSLTSYWAWSKCIKFLLIYNSIHYCICSNKFVHDSFPPKQI